MAFHLYRPSVYRPTEPSVDTAFPGLFLESRISPILSLMAQHSLPAGMVRGASFASDSFYQHNQHITHASTVHKTFVFGDVYVSDIKRNNPLLSTTILSVNFSFRKRNRSSV